MTASNVGMPRVSVIIPTYNRANFLPQTIQSVLSQAFTDFEILVVDDGSTDGTERLVQQIEDSRVVYIRQPHSGLPAVARNAGLHHARGEYIAFLDSDDLWLSEKLTVQVRYMDLHPELGLTYTNAFTFEDKPEQCSLRPIVPQNMSLSGYAFEQLYGRQNIPNLTVMIRSSVVQKVGLFDEDVRLKANEDYEYWLRIAYHYPIGFIDKPLARYRQHAEGISKAAVATNQAKLFLIKKLDYLYPDFVTQHSDERRHWQSRVHYGLGRALLREHQVAESRYHLKESWKLQPRLVTFLFWGASFVGKWLYRRLDGAKTKLLSGCFHNGY